MQPDRSPQRSSWKLGGSCRTRKLRCVRTESRAGENRPGRRDALLIATS